MPCYRRSLSVLFLAACTLWGQNAALRTVRDYESDARSAFQNKDYRVFLDAMEKAIALQPDHPRLLHNLAIAYALNARPDDALARLRTLAAMGLSYRVEENDSFVSLRGRPDFRNIVEQMARNRLPRVRSRPEVTVHEKGIIPESIAYDEKTRRYYMSSVYRRQILRIEPSGALVEFAGESQGLWSVMGMKIDGRRRRLWACTAAQPQMRGFRPEEDGSSAVLKFDLDTGKLLKRYLLPNRPERHWLGDLAIRSNGDVFATDSLSPVIYQIPHDRDEIEPFLSGEPFVNLQGLDFSADGKRFFVADYSRGLFRVNIATKQVTPLPAPPNVTLLGIDGLYRHGNTLIAIQNGVNPQRVVRITLVRGGRSASAFEVLEANNPLFDEPTLGFVRKNDFYFIADSQWGAVEKTGRLASPEKLLDPVILKLRL